MIEASFARELPKAAGAFLDWNVTWPTLAVVVPEDGHVFAVVRLLDFSFRYDAMLAACTTEAAARAALRLLSGGCS